MATADEEAMEGHRGGLEMGVAQDPVGPIPVVGECHGCRFGVSAHHESGVRGSRESAPRGQGGGRGRREGGPRPALECTFLLSFLFGGQGGVFFLLFFLTVGGVGGPL